MRYAILIPARMVSTRFPGKCLADIHGEPLIWRVYEGCRGSLDVNNSDIFVITPDDEIAEAVRDRGGKVVETGLASTVLERCASVASSNSFDQYDRIIVVQGDEPMVKPEMIDLCVRGWKGSVNCLVKRLGPGDDPSDPNMVKLVMNQSNHIIYFSRQPIPGMTPERHEGIERPSFYKQVCVMGFSRPILEQYNTWSLGPLERAEGIDQLRYIENGWIGLMGIPSEFETQAVDTQADLDKVRELMK